MVILALRKHRKRTVTAVLIANLGLITFKIYLLLQRNCLTEILIVQNTLDFFLSIRRYSYDDSREIKD